MGEVCVPGQKMCPAGARCHRTFNRCVGAWPHLQTWRLPLRCVGTFGGGVVQIDYLAMFRPFCGCGGTEFKNQGEPCGILSPWSVCRKGSICVEQVCVAEVGTVRVDVVNMLSPCSTSLLFFMFARVVT